MGPLMKTPLYSDVLLASKTTFKIGGPAKRYAQPACVEEALECLAWAKQRGEPVFVLGKGSNVLVSDRGWPGLVIDIGANFDAINWEENAAVCLGGAALVKLVREMAGRRLRGLEYLAGIPGSVGGALVMNAGAYGHVITECVESVDYFDLDEEKVLSVSSGRLEASYRRTVFSGKRALILSGRFRFSPDPAAEAEEIVRQCNVKRREKHPLDLPNCGSVFKNLPGPISAASLIEKSGLKGFRIGNAEVSRKHANFISEFRRRDRGGCGRHYQACSGNRDRKEQGIVLEPEVVTVGEFEEGVDSL